MANDKESADNVARLERQRREAQAAIDRNRVELGNGKYRSLVPKERALYQRVVKRVDKLLGPIPKPPGKSGASGLKSGLRVLKRFAERVLEGKKKIEDIPENMGNR